MLLLMCWDSQCQSLTAQEVLGAQGLGMSARGQGGSLQLKHSPGLRAPVSSTAVPARCLGTWVSLVSTYGISVTGTQPAQLTPLLTVSPGGIRK